MPPPVYRGHFGKPQAERLLWPAGFGPPPGEAERPARELMELFTLGAGRGYTERDVRQQARALTGWRNDWSRNLGPVRFRFDKERHDTGVKTIFGHRGRYDWRDSGRLCTQHRLHPSF